MTTHEKDHIRAVPSADAAELPHACSGNEVDTQHEEQTATNHAVSCGFGREITYRDVQGQTCETPFASKGTYRYNP